MLTSGCSERAEALGAKIRAEAEEDFAVRELEALAGAEREVAASA